ncbi:MAG: hypothetical protein WEB00_15770 [Dehalococcoidia bacterium]
MAVRIRYNSGTQQKDTLHGTPRPVLTPRATTIAACTQYPAEPALSTFMSSQAGCGIKQLKQLKQPNNCKANLKGPQQVPNNPKQRSPAPGTSRWG